MNFLKNSAYLAFAIVLVGCGGTQLVSIAPQRTLVKHPALNLESEVEVGQSMISVAMVVETPAIEIASEIAHSEGSWKLSISPGVLPISRSDDKGSFYRAQGNSISLRTLGITQPPGTTDGGIFIPSDKSKPTEIFWMGSFGAPVRGVHPGIEFKDTTYERVDKSSFKRELVYSGVSQNTISILYREFLNDMARPAFSQELKYDLSQGTTIGYKGARFDVIKANNTGIVYKVLKSLD